MLDALNISGDRAQVAMEACWEVEALCGAMRDLTAASVQAQVSPADTMRLSLQARGLMARIEGLNSVLMSILANDDETSNLQRRVFGASLPKEAAHG